MSNHLSMSLSFVMIAVSSLSAIAGGPSSEPPPATATVLNTPAGVECIVTSHLSGHLTAEVRLYAFDRAGSIRTVAGQCTKPFLNRMVVSFDMKSTTGGTPDLGATQGCLVTRVVTTKREWTDTSSEEQMATRALALSRHARAESSSYSSRARHATDESADCSCLTVQTSAAPLLCRAAVRSVVCEPGHHYLISCR